MIALVASVLVTIFSPCGAFRADLTHHVSSRRGGVYANRQFRVNEIMCGGGSSPSQLLLLQMSTSGNDGSAKGSDEIDKLKETASRLRAEAQTAERALEGTRGAPSEGTTSYVKPVEYVNLNDSCWEIT